MLIAKEQTQLDYLNEICEELILAFVKRLLIFSLLLIFVLSFILCIYANITVLRILTI